jgi:hypothetical protein
MLNFRTESPLHPLPSTRRQYVHKHPRPHLGRDPDGLHQFLACRAVAECGLGVPLDAIRALRHVRHGNRDQLLGLRRQRAVGEYLAAERLAFSVSGVRARRFSANSRDDGGYRVSVISYSSSLTTATERPSIYGSISGNLWSPTRIICSRKGSSSYSTSSTGASNASRALSPLLDASLDPGPEHSSDVAL